VTFKFISGTAVPVPGDRPIPDHHLDTCFGCGPNNPHRLGIEPVYENDRVSAEMAFEDRYEGGPGLVHGGVVAAWFDDLLGFVALMHQKPAVTAKLEVNYRRPIPLGIRIRSEAWLSSIDGRKLHCEGVAYDEKGEILVEAVGLFIRVRPEHFRGTRTDQPSPYPESMYESDEYYP
jgi:uncharacterized protein (TIGR00369 family)